MYLLVQKKQDRRLVVHLSGEAEVDPGRTSVGVVPAVARGSSWRRRRERRRQVGAEAEELKGGSGGGRSRDTGRRCVRPDRTCPAARGGRRLGFRPNFGGGGVFIGRGS